MNRRILFLCHRVPYPPDKGDRIRSFHLLKHLIRIGKVHLGFLTDEPVPEATSQKLEELCERVFYTPVSNLNRWFRAGMNLLQGRSATEGLFFSPDFRNQIENWLEQEQFDAVVCFSSATLQYVFHRGIETRLIVDLVDVDSQKWFDYANRVKKPFGWLFEKEGCRVRQIETRAARARSVVLVTEAEAAIYRDFCPQANVSVITNGVDLDYFHPQKSLETVSCVFVGYLDYRANILGLQWFCNNVWPQIYERYPDSTFQIVGRNPKPAVKRLERIPGVTVVGPVQDIRPLLVQSRTVVVPLLVARGVQNKILEAMAMGKAIVASPEALKGMPLEKNLHLLQAKSADEWIQAISSLLLNEEKRRTLGCRAREYVEQNHSWSHCLKEFNSLIEGKQLVSCS